ncbi:MAG: LysR family transcriptional regulator [Aquabacterium sp.]
MSQTFASFQTRRSKMDQAKKLRRYLRHGMMPQLAAFEAVFRLQSVTRAGEALHMAQPTVSGHLRKLTEAMGVVLFRCDGRRMIATPAAAALHQAVQEVFGALNRVDDVLAAMRAAAESAATSLATPTPGPTSEHQQGAKVVHIGEGRPRQHKIA